MKVILNKIKLYISPVIVTDLCPFLTTRVI